MSVHQLEGIENIRDMGAETNYWGWVDCGVGRMFLGGNDDGIAMRFYNGYVYEPESVKLWKGLCEDAALVIDVGAHTGFYSLAAWQAGAKAVVSIEPYYLNAARLHLNLRGNGHGVDGCGMCAASDEDRIVELYVPQGPGGVPLSYCTGAGSLKRGKGSWAFPVRARPLDAMLAEDFRSTVVAMKLDVEYHLLRALTGATKILGECKPDLIFECFEFGVDDLLRPFGYRFWLINEVTGLKPVDALLPRDPASSRNYFASVRGIVRA